MSAWRFRLDADYWDRKLSNYLHDPPDKALGIPGHEDRTRRLAEVLGPLPAPDPVAYQRADRIAAGMDRTQLPPHHPDEELSGSIDFQKTPVLTHPTGSKAPLTLRLPSGLEAEAVSQAVSDLVEADISDLTKASEFRGNPAALAAARFHYVHHCLRDRLAWENAAGLGGLWHRLPADTRLPDHSIWQHCALVSALTSCFALSDTRQASLMVFALTPVQDFISKARKLRDFWSGSLLLSWLTFEGLRPVIYELGTDHVIYPSLIGQPLVNRLLAQECRFDLLPGAAQTKREETGVASLPNKFVCLVPTGRESHFAQEIQLSILEAWQDLGAKTLEIFQKTLGREDSYLSEQMARQMESFWDFHWSACPLLDEAAADRGKELLPEKLWQQPFRFCDHSKNLGFPSGGEGAFYPLTHALSQSFLAAGKGFRENRRPSEQGIKCGLHGDLEILRFTWQEGEDRNPRPGRDPLWSQFRRQWQPESDFKPTERLSAIATVKRLAYRVIRQHPDHALHPFFAEEATFPSTTEMALDDWYRQVEKQETLKNILEELPNWRQVLAQVVHEQEADAARPEDEPEILPITSEKRSTARQIMEVMARAGAPLGNEDKYFALLLMDGDHMGKLVNGETLASCWETALHPVLVERLQRPQFPKNHREFWQEELRRPRSLAPSVHAAISESLGDFSLFTVPALMEKYRGRLIYAGGDDVCALLPAAAALPAAREIASWYNRAFLFISERSASLPLALSDTWEPGPGRLSLHLGSGENLSISAGILIAHHKQPLAGVIRRGHELLKKAKEQGGRNAVALELKKRGGGPALFLAKWQEGSWPRLDLGLPPEKDNLITLLEELAEALGRPPYRELSASLIYRLQELQPGLEIIAAKTPTELAAFLQAQVQRSQKEEDQVQAAHLACRLAALLVRPPSSEKSSPVLTIDPLLIAKFLGSRRFRDEAGKGGA